MSKSTFLKRLSMGSAVAVLAFAAASFHAPLAMAAVSEKSAKSFEKAQSYIEKGDTKAAIIEFKNAIRQDADNVEARFQLGAIYLAQGDFDGAEKEFRSAMARGYDKGVVIPILANTLIVQGKSRELIEEFGNTVLDDASANARLAVRRGQAYLAQQKFEEVTAQTDLAKQSDPDLPEIYVLESWLRQAEGDLPAAEAAVDIALEKAGESQEALSQKAELRRLQGDGEAAIDFATKALKVNPYRRQPLITRGLAYVGLNDVDNAQKDGDTLLERQSRDPMGAFFKSWALAQKNDVEGALAVLSAGQDVEAFLPALYLSAALHLRAGQLEQARAKIDRFLGKAPNSTRGLMTSAAISYQSGEFDQAVRVLQPLYEQDPANAEVTTMLAYAYEQLGEAAKAAALFDEARAMSPDNDDLAFQSAKAKIGSGDFEAGVEELAGLVDSTTGGVRAATMIFLAHLQNKDFDKATTALDQLEEAGGVTAETENYRASIALARNELDAGVEHLKSALKIDPSFKASRLNLARVYQAKGDKGAARKQFDELLKADPGYLPALRGLTTLAAEDGNTVEVERLMLLSVEQNPKAEQAHHDLVNLYISRRQYDRALVAAREFMNQLPDNAAAYDSLGRAQMAAGEGASSIVTYQQLTKMRPEDPKSHLRLAGVQIQEEKFTDAMYSLDRALSLDPTNATAKRTRVDLEKQVYGNDRARALARSLFRNTEGDPRAKSGLGQALIALDNKQEGIKLIEEAFDETQRRGELIELYQAYDTIGERDKATQLFVDWLKAHPEERPIRVALFSRYISLGQYELATTNGETLYKENQDDIVVLNNLAWLYEKKGRIEDAISYSKRAYDLSPNAAEIADTYGWILHDHGDATEAEKVMRRAAELAPTRRDIQYHHASTLAKVGKKDEAIAKLKEILNKEGYFDGRDQAADLLGKLE